MKMGKSGRVLGALGAGGFLSVALLGLSVSAVRPALAQETDTGREMEKQYGVVGRNTPEGRALNDQLDRVTQKITAAVGYKLRSAKLLGGADAKTDKVVNAFALPDGRIYVTLGLMREIQKAPDSDAELAFVVGHETTHVVKHHGESQQKAAVGAGVAAILIGAATRSRAAGTLANVGGSAYVMHFSRDDEYEADRGGLMAMNKAGYPPEGAINMLKRLQDVSGAQPNPTLNGWFGTHPLTGNRVKKIQSLIDRAHAQQGGNPTGN